MVLADATSGYEEVMIWEPCAARRILAMAPRAILALQLCLIHVLVSQGGSASLILSMTKRPRRRYPSTQLRGRVEVEDDHRVAIRRCPIPA